jgi:hypothetical protein
MKYSDVMQLLPNSPYIYANVTEEEVDAVIGHKYVTYYNDIRVLGTMELIEELEPKLLQVGSVNFN